MEPLIESMVAADLQKIVGSSQVILEISYDYGLVPGNRIYLTTCSAGMVYELGPAIVQDSRSGFSRVY